MVKSKFSKEQIARAVGARHREPIHVPFYFSAPGLEELRDRLEAKLSSRGGRPGVANWVIVRKTRYSAKTWKNLKLLAGQWSRGGASISPAQVAAELIEGAVSSIRS